MNAFRLWTRFRAEERAESTSTHAILMAIGAVLALGVLATVGRALYAYFQQFSQCLNGC